MFDSIRSSLAAWREKRSGNASGTGFVPAAPVLSGTYVTPQTALSLAAVFAAINVISRDWAGLPRIIERRLPNGGFERDEKHYLNEILNVTPDCEIDAFSHFQSSMAHTLGWGTGPSEIVRSPKDGRVVQLKLLHPAKTIPKRHEKSRVLYYELDNKKELLAENVLAFNGMGFDGIKGYSPITCARQTIGLALGAEQFGAAFFGNGAMPKGVLKTPKRLSEPAQNNLRSTWNQIHQGSQGAHQIAILEEGVEWVNTQISPDDGQWIATREFQVKDIARLFCLPPHKVGDYSESHLANVEEANDDYISMCLGGWINMGEAQMNFKLLTREDREKYRIRIDIGALSRANTKDRTTMYQILRNVGAVTVDEIRIREGMKPVGEARGGNLLVMQGQYLPLDQIGKAPITPPTPTPTPSPEPIPEPAIAA